ncbi:unnamed protein product [Adineta steineri]|uniref:Uncharacterized protein n=1 Tax=Adineta steineri TaxID=433720 RepID=A0A818I9Y1_9BILA|nr:unnamed protein product [Adineta steineri]CAF3516117.1 unnamed protein product [Adineta steineri]
MYPSLVNEKSKNNSKYSNIILYAAVFHMFLNNDRQIYIKSPEYLIKPNGVYVHICFNERETREGGLRRIKKAHLNELFSSDND